MQVGKYIRTNEIRRKMSLSAKGRIPWNRGLKGVQVAWNKGKPSNPESNLKQSMSMKKRYAEGMKVWNAGLKGMRLSPASEFKKGRVPWNKGKKGIYNREYIKKLKESHTGKVLNKASNWQGGKSFEPYSPLFNSQVKSRVKVRDNFICQLCGVPELECDRELSIHHIDYDKKNNSLINLISLCVKCHGRTNGNRNYWINYFSKIIQEAK